jgi:NADP-dependent 3-hydroxy acid dehydrogenase YdfG
VTNEAEVDAAFKKASEQFGPIDILVNNAGYAPTFGAITELDVAEAWIAFETNVKGSLLVARAFERAANKMEAIVIETSSIVAIMPPYVGSVSYTASKLATTKVWSFFGAENPQVRVIHVQPGQVQTDMADSIGLKNLPDHGRYPNQTQTLVAAN